MHITQTVRAAAPHGDRTPSRGDHKMRGARREHVSSLYRRRRLVEVASVAAALWPEPPHCGRRAPLSPRVEPANEWCYSRLRPELRGMRTSRPKGSARPYVLHRAVPARGTQPHRLAAGRSALRAGLVEEHRARFRRHGPPSAAGHSGGRRSWPGTAHRSQTTASVHRIRHSMAP